MSIEDNHLVAVQHPGRFALLIRLWQQLSGRRRRQMYLIFGLMLLNAFTELCSLGAVIPFLGILTAPDKVFGYFSEKGLAQAWKLSSANEMVLPLTAAFCFAALTAGVIRLVLAWANNHFASSAGCDLSVEVYRRTLYQPYRVHIARNNSEVISGIILKISTVVFGVMHPALTLASSLIVLFAITIGLLAIDVTVTLLAVGGFGLSYLYMTWLSRRRLERNGERIAVERTQVIKALQEGLGGIRDVLLDGTQPLYCEIYRRSDGPLRRALANNAFILQCPRHVMESLGMVLIAVLAYWLSQQPGADGTALAVIGALALGAQRVLPALQQIYASWGYIVESQASLADSLELLEQPLPPEASQHQAVTPLTFKDSIRFDGVSFRYQDDGPWVLDGLDFTVRKGSRVGFVGTTGSGKSTALDLLMALLEPTRGQILVDGQSISGDRRRAWQQTIAHVPQDIYLADTTLAENIAFGARSEEIDMERVRLAARRAQIADFIESGPNGYQAFAGERGVRLSGGQRQRIGIARALYKRANVLVLDEATSALDSETEQVVMDTIEQMGLGITILIIAHRLTTVQRCDKIIKLEYGAVVFEGPYKDLLDFGAGISPRVSIHHVTT